MSSNEQIGFGAFQIAILASILLATNIVSLIWFGYFYHYVEHDNMDTLIVVSSLIASAGLLASVLLSVNGFVRITRFMFDIGAFAFLVYVLMLAVRMIELEEQSHYYFW